MKVGALTPAILGLMALMVAIGCAETTFDKLPADFTRYLVGNGQVFTSQPAPVDAVDWRSNVPIGFPFPGAVVKSAAFGVVTCVEPENCAGGLVRPGEALPIWVLSFVDSVAAGGCPTWVVLDAHTGAAINGAGPPCV